MGDHSHAKRVLGSLAFDVRPFEGTVIETNYSYYHLIDTGCGLVSYGEKSPCRPIPPTGLRSELRHVDLLTRMGACG